LNNDANAQNISTIAGTGTPVFAGDGGLATSAGLYYPKGMFVDASGNVYFGEYSSQRIRKITASTGIISTIAGTGTYGYSGDGGAATSAQLNYPTGVCADASGNVYIADTYNDRIRKITSSTGIISTIAGTGTGGYSGDGGAATNAELSNPKGVSVDGSGNVYIADSDNYRIRKITASTGIISTIAGTGTAGNTGDGAAATNAQLSTPTGVSLDASGNIYIADYYNHSVRKVIASTGIIVTIAGNGAGGYSGDGGSATSAQLYYPYAVSVDASGNVYISDEQNHRIRKVNPSTGFISSIAGTGTAGYSGDGGPATSAELNYPTGVSVDISSNVYILEWGNHRIRKITVDPTATTEHKIFNKEITIYPNPVSNSINISGITTKTTIKMYDVFGKLVMQKETESNIILNTDQIAQGIYTLETESNAGRAVNKIIINK